MKLTGYSISAGTAFRRGPCIVAHDGNVVAPICYLRRPKWLGQAEFIEICNSIRLTLKVGHELKGLEKS